MDNEELWELKKRLAVLPSLKVHLDRLQSQINESEEKIKALLSKYESEALDVERLRNESFSALIIKTFGRFEEKLDKETQEMLRAKAEYDKACENLSQLKIKKDELKKRIELLEYDNRRFADELKRREEEIRCNLSSEASIKYRELEEVEKFLSAQLVETQEAIRAAKIALNTIGEATNHLDSAESWATYDIWFKSGIFTHMAKYDHIDKSKEAFNRLSSQIRELQRELSDVNITQHLTFSGVDSTTRAIDFWFDNIFTDLNVRDSIRNDAEQLRKLNSQISSIISRLYQNETDIDRRVQEIEQKKTSLIIDL